MKDRRHNSGKGSKRTRITRNNLRSGSAIDNPKDFDFGLLDLDACVDFPFVLSLGFD